MTDKEDKQIVGSSVKQKKNGKKLWFYTGISFPISAKKSFNKGGHNEQYQDVILLLIDLKNNVKPKSEA